MSEGLAAVVKKGLLRWQDRLFAVSVPKGGGEREEVPWSDNTAAVLVDDEGDDRRTGHVEGGKRTGERWRESGRRSRAA